MANEADMADDFIEAFLADSLERQRTAVSNIPAARGTCLNCEETVAAGRRWCDQDCRDDWQRIEDARRRSLGLSPLNMPVGGPDRDADE